MDGWSDIPGAKVWDTVNGFHDINDYFFDYHYVLRLLTLTGKTFRNMARKLFPSKGLIL